MNLSKYIIGKQKISITKKTILLILFVIPILNYAQTDSSNFDCDINLEVKNLDTTFLLKYVIEIENFKSNDLYGAYSICNRKVDSSENEISIRMPYLKSRLPYGNEDTVFIELTDYYMCNSSYSGKPNPPFSFIKVAKGEKKKITIVERCRKTALNRDMDYVCRYVVFSDINYARKLNHSRSCWRRKENIESGEVHVFCKHFILKENVRIIKGKDDVAKKYNRRWFFKY